VRAARRGTVEADPDARGAVHQLGGRVELIRGGAHGGDVNASAVSFSHTYFDAAGQPPVPPASASR
jgi:hypothetical protein